MNLTLTLVCSSCRAGPVFVCEMEEWLEIGESFLGGPNRAHYWWSVFSSNFSLSRLQTRGWLMAEYSPSHHTTGASGIGELLANTLAVRNVTVVALDIKKPAFDNGLYTPTFSSLPFIFVSSCLPLLLNLHILSFLPRTKSSNHPLTHSFSFHFKQTTSHSTNATYPTGGLSRQSQSKSLKRFVSLIRLGHVPYLYNSC